MMKKKRMISFLTVFILCLSSFTVNAESEKQEMDAAEAEITEEAEKEEQTENDGDPVFSDNVCTSPEGHLFTDVKEQAPTCTEQGYSYETCERCGYVHCFDYTDPLGHTEEILEGYDAECTKDGLTDGIYCSACGSVIKEQEVIPAAGHTFVNNEEAGKETDSMYCTACNETISCDETEKAETEHEDNETESETEHIHTAVTDPAEDPTCTEPGLTEGSHCSVCGEILKTQQVIPATGHEYEDDEGYAPTCTEPGLTDKVYCDICGYVIQEAEVIPASGHTIVIDEGYDSDCVDAGLTEGSHCEVCGAVITKQEELPLKDHSFEWVITKNVSNTENGERCKICSVCGAVGETEIIPAYGLGSEDGSENAEPVQTGDDMSFGMFSAMMMISLCLIFAMSWMKKDTETR